jgi:hypothetical protein
MALAMVEVARPSGERAVGVGRGPDIVRASLQAIARAAGEDVLQLARGGV